MIVADSLSNNYRFVAIGRRSCFSHPQQILSRTVHGPVASVRRSTSAKRWAKLIWAVSRPAHQGCDGVEDLMEGVLALPGGPARQSEGRGGELSFLID